MNGEEIIHSADIFRQEIKYFVKLNLLVFCRNNYQVENKLGEGGFGAVYQVSRKDSEKKFAAKIIKDKKKGKEEINILKRLENDFILRLYNLLQTTLMLQLHWRFEQAFEDRRELIIVTEYLDGGELFDKIVDEDELLESDCCYYIRQVCQVYLRI